MLIILATAVAVVAALLLWAVKSFKETYFWKTESGDVIQGSGFRAFSPTLIGWKDSSLTKFRVYLLRFLPGPPKLIITDPQIAVKFMAKQHKYLRMKDFRLGSVFRRMFGEAAGAASGQSHKRIRSTFDNCYSSESVAQKVEMMVEECQRYLRLVIEEKKGILTMDDMIELTFRMLVKFTYGSDVSEDEMRELNELRALVFSLISDSFTNPFAKFPFYEYLPTETNQRLAEFKHRWMDFNKVYEKRFQEGRLKDRSCVFYKLQETLSSNPEAVTEKELQQTLEESSLVNVDITCGAAAWLLFHVALHQNVQNELVEEVKDTVAELSGPLTLDIVNKMDHLDKVVKESARKRPVMVISMPEYIPCPMMIGDFKSPAGVEVSVDNSAVNSDPEVWGEPNVFNPRRFDNETPSMRKSLCRFGIGPRRCMGYRLADAFMKVLLITLLRNFRLALETSVTGDDNSVPVDHVGPLCFPRVRFKIEPVQ